MSSVPKHYLLYAAGVPLLVLGLLLATAITPTPIEPIWKWYLPPTLPGTLIWAGVASSAIGAVMGRRGTQEPRWAE